MSFSLVGESDDEIDSVSNPPESPVKLPAARPALSFHPLTHRSLPVFPGQHLLPPVPIADSQLSSPAAGMIDLKSQHFENYNNYKSVDIIIFINGPIQF